MKEGRPRPTARHLRHDGDWQRAVDTCTLSYDQRFLRRKVLTSESGIQFLVDLAHAESANHGDAFDLGSGMLIKVIAAEEPLLEVRGPHLVRLAWHIGNRHCPCQVEPDHLLIQKDHVIRDMLAQLGAAVQEVSRPFTPEGGAYGHGRTHAHEH